MLTFVRKRVRPKAACPIIFALPKNVNRSTARKVRENALKTAEKYNRQEFVRIKNAL